MVYVPKKDKKNLTAEDAESAEKRLKQNNKIFFWFFPLPFSASSAVNKVFVGLCGEKFKIFFDSV